MSSSERSDSGGLPTSTRRVFISSDRRAVRAHGPPWGNEAASGMALAGGAGWEYKAGSREVQLRAGGAAAERRLGLLQETPQERRHPDRWPGPGAGCGQGPGLEREARPAGRTDGWHGREEGRQSVQSHERAVSGHTRKAGGCFCGRTEARDYLSVGVPYCFSTNASDVGTHLGPPAQVAWAPGLWVLLISM